MLTPLMGLVLFQYISSVPCLNTAMPSNLELLVENALLVLGCLLLKDAVVPATQHTVGEVDC